MQKLGAILFWIFFSTIVYAQECPDLVSPVNGSTNVAVDARITWEPTQGVTGNIVSVGTTPGGGEIINQRAIGSANFIKPPVGLPENTRIYITVTLFFFDRPNITCTSQSFTTEQVSVIPQCTLVSQPANGADNVNIATNISWDYASKATSYRISIGTSTGASDVLNNADVGNVLSYDPANDFNPSTLYYVRIVPYNENGEALGCSESTFITGVIASLPGCTQLISPVNGATNVPLSPLVEWQEVPGATGYRIFIGKTPDENNILDGGNFTATSTFVFNFEDNNVYFIRIVPFNEAGEAIGCQQESFSTIIGCGPFFSLETGDLIDLRPEITFPDVIGICSGVSETFSADTNSQGYRWFKKNFSNEELISTDREVSIAETGTYILEAYNNTENGELECSSRKEFDVVESEKPTIENVDVEELETGLNITVLISGEGDYEFSLTPEGPYQDSNSFLDIPFETEFVYARDKNGCGIDEYQIKFKSINNGFPKFFTPNGDGFNDRWQFKPKGNEDFVLISISIFNRYGKLLKTINPNSNGWDGKISGVMLPTSDYWYRADTNDGRSFSGHFALRR